MLIYVAMDFIFAGGGGVLMGFALSSEQRMSDSPTVDNVAQNLLLAQCPLTGTAPPDTPPSQEAGAEMRSASRLYHGAHDEHLTWTCAINQSITNSTNVLQPAW